jgi:hypothetical protein
LAGEEIKTTPKEYAEKWREALVTHGKLLAKAYHPPAVETPYRLTTPGLRYRTNPNQETRQAAPKSQP